MDTSMAYMYIAQHAMCHEDAQLSDQKGNRLESLQ